MAHCFVNHRFDEGPPSKRADGEARVSTFSGRWYRYPDRTGGRLDEGGRRLLASAPPASSDRPLVSVITVCYNAHDTIAQTFASIRNQSYDAIDYIVVDGASDDGTLDVIRAHEDMISYYVSEPDSGLYHAMNKGIELAQGAYILFLNADDWLAAHAIETLVEAADYAGVDIVSALGRYIDPAVGSSQVMRALPFDDSTLLRMPLRHETMLVPAALYDAIGPYDTRYRIIADRHWTARAFEAGATSYVVPQPLLNFRTTGVSNSDTAGIDRDKQALLADSFPFLSEADRQLLAQQHAASPEDLAEVANRHLDAPNLVKAIRALLEDRRRHAGQRWQSEAVDTIGAPDRRAWPLVSVILPFYQAQDTLQAALQSVLDQTLSELEIVCVNDCAVDDSQSVVAAMQAQDDRIRCLQNPRNLGLGASRNAGIAAARGRYIFHLDPDDTLPPDALAALYEAAQATGAQMTKGAYRAGQGLHAAAPVSVSVKYPGGARQSRISGLTLGQAPRLLATTEGHWSYLYEASFARAVAYPRDLKMGQDSIFLVHALAQAQSITLEPTVVYNYEANPDSAMNSFTPRKYRDGLEWRRRAWHVLNDFGRARIADQLLFGYWSTAFFDGLDASLTEAEGQAFYDRLRAVFAQSGYPGRAELKAPGLRARFDAMMAGAKPAPLAVDRAGPTPPDETPLRVTTLTTQFGGGAGIGSQRRVAALRAAGADARIHYLFGSGALPDHAQRLPPAEHLDQKWLREQWREQVVVTRQDHPQLVARELFSKPGGVLDFREIDELIQQSDIVHLHWVAGLFDFENTHVLGRRPVVWTLADMNAFTGGCHYSEGCTKFESDCSGCPLIAHWSTMAHDHWTIKAQAYARLPDLHIVCPSPWMARRVRASSLLGDRPVHVIPNALPVDRFTPVNRVVARAELGLPLDRKYIAFGAENLTNRRKGGDILIEALGHLVESGRAKGVEGLLFGSSALDLPIPVHSMGSVSDERQLARIYAAADVFAFPSREDNAPLTAVEALLSGTPVVGFEVGNLPDLMHHRRTGYFARYGQAKDFAEGLRWALEHCNGPRTLERRLACHQHARGYNDPVQAAQRHLRLYHRILAAERTGHRAAGMAAFPGTGRVEAAQ